VPAVWGSLEQADQLYEAVKKARGLKYMMFETSYFHPGLWPMRQIYKAGGFGKHVYSEGEYYHYHDGSAPMPSYKGWRDGPPPLWYATHSTAYYVGVTGGTLTHVSCQAKPSNWYWLKPGANKFDNTHATETALFHTSDGGAFRALCCYDSPGHEGVKGRFRGELGSFDGDAGDGKNWGTFAGLTDGKGNKKALPNLKVPSKARPRGMFSPVVAKSPRSTPVGENSRIRLSLLATKRLPFLSKARPRGWFSPVVAKSPRSVPPSENLRIVLPAMLET